MRKNRPNGLELHVIKETGDILQYLGEVLTDPHKGEYSSEWKVYKAVTLLPERTYLDYQLYNKNTDEYYTLERLPQNTVNLLYGKKV